MSDQIVSFRATAVKQLEACGVLINNEKLDVIVNLIKLTAGNRLLSGLDLAELEIVRKNFVEKHCGVFDKERGLDALERVVGKMAKFKMKNRAAFYYLALEKLS